MFKLLINSANASRPRLNTMVNFTSLMRVKRSLLQSVMKSRARSNIEYVVKITSQLDSLKLSKLNRATQIRRSASSKKALDGP